MKCFNLKVQNMRRTIIAFFVMCLFAQATYAATVTIPTTYAATGTVTSTNLNGNFTAIANVVNGGLDNGNVDTTNGYRLFKTVAVLPSSGTQGAVYFLTSDNTINFDTGSSFIKTVAISATPAQGDVLYYTGSAWSNLAAGTSGYYLKTQGALANPTWANVVPTGVIVMWSGTIATIPSGWALCNGSNGTPDLRNRFVVAADADSGGAAKSTITGLAAQTSEGQLPSTTVTITQFNTGNSGAAFGTGIPTDGASSSALSGSFGTGTANVARFYALAYIMKT